MHRLALLVVLASGCTFPDPTVTEGVAGDSSLTDSAAGDSAKTDTGVVGDGGTDSSIVDSSGDTNKPDVPDAGDTGLKDTGIVVDTMDPCDKDKDGVKASGGACGGMDCDDNDSNATPNQTMFLTLDITGKAHKGDWNCNGMVEKLIAVNQACPALSGAACDGTKGFQGDPACGTSGNYLTCKSNGLGCEGTVNTTMTIKQACK
jgi:hypothetical protein